MKTKTRKQRYNEIISAASNDLNACVVELAERYLKDFPNSQGVWDMYSLALYRTDRFKDAKKACLKAIALLEEPNKQNRLSWLLLRIGHIFEDSGKFLKAIKWYEKAHNENQNEATFLIYQGRMFLRIEKFDEAAKAFQKATKCKEGCVDEAFYNLGVTRLIQKIIRTRFCILKKPLKLMQNTKKRNNS